MAYPDITKIQQSATGRLVFAGQALSDVAERVMSPY